MPSQREIDAAAKAILRRQNAPSLTRLEWIDLGPKSQHGYLEDARVALEAAEAAREIERRENCTHQRKQGIGAIGSDGAACMRWHCQDCFKSWDVASVGGMTRIG